MRGALGLARCVVLAWGALGCTATSVSPTGRPDVDTGTFPFRDAAIDATVDAFDWPDTGPPLPPVLPAQSWVLDANINGQSFEVTFDIEPRAEAGTVRVVAGANGRAASAVFDILEGGVLRARTPIPIGVPGDHTCTYDTFAIDQWILVFQDHDADGIHETLTSATASSTITLLSRTLPRSSLDAFVSVSNIRADTSGPTLALMYVAPVAAFDPVIVVANEPVAPSFMPRLVGPRTVLLAPDVGASAPARWTAETRGLPPGHYDLVLDTEVRDLAGHLAAPEALPALSLDVAVMGAPAADDIDPAVVSIFAAETPTVIGDDAGEVPLLGSTSLLTRGRTVIAFDSRAGHRTLSLLLRFEEPSLVGQTAAMISVYDASGALVGQGTDYQYFMPPASIAGFDLETPTHTFFVGYVAATAGRYYALLEPGGPLDQTCTGMPAVLGVATMLDQIIPM